MREGSHKGPKGEQSGLWATVEDDESDSFMKKEMRGIICFQVFDSKGKVFEWHCGGGCEGVFQVYSKAEFVMLWEKV